MGRRGARGQQPPHPPRAACPARQCPLMPSEAGCTRSQAPTRRAKAASAAKTPALPQLRAACRLARGPEAEVGSGRCRPRQAGRSPTGGRAQAGASPDCGLHCLLPWPMAPLEARVSWKLSGLFLSLAAPSAWPLAETTAGQWLLTIPNHVGSLSTFLIYLPTYPIGTSSSCTVAILSLSSLTGLLLLCWWMCHHPLTCLRNSETFKHSFFPHHPSQPHSLRLLDSTFCVCQPLSPLLFGSGSQNLTDLLHQPPKLYSCFCPCVIEPTLSLLLGESEIAPD